MGNGIDEIEKSKLRELIPLEDLQRASNRTIEIPYSEYLGGVIEFLALDDRSPYEGEKAWDAMRLSLIAFMENLSKSAAGKEE